MKWQIGGSGSTAAAAVREAGFSPVPSRRLAAPVAPLDYLVEGLVPRGTLVLLAASAGVGKTWLLADLAIAIATGGRWLERPCVKGPVLYLDYENGERELHHRFQVLSKGRGVAVPSRNLALAPDQGNIDNDEFEEKLERATRFCRAVIIDPFKTAAPQVDENSSDVRVPLDRLRRVAAKTECGIFVAHHAGKGATKAEELVRGSSAFMDAPQLVFVLRADREDLVVLETVKTRFGKRTAPIGIERTDRVGALRLHVREIKSKTDLAEEQRRQSIIEALRKAGANGLSGKELEERTGRKADYIRRSRERMVSDRTIVRSGPPKRPRFFLPPSSQRGSSPQD
jgi:predicted ATP-dependent serine protease